MEKIGEYLVKRLVGEGGMGKVYEAEERLSKRRVALKVLRPELTRHEDGRRLFLNEMQILAHLEHPNIVRSLASMEIDDQLVMALEFLEGRTLRAELNARGKVPWQEAVGMIVKIAEALQVAHSQEPPIIHRDLKPENVMILANGEGLKVMDFGIAKVLAAAHATNTQSIGTLQYMSPEQIDAKTIDPRSDLYSLGLIFYEMLSGSPPFHSASPRELLNLQCTQAAPDLSDEIRQGMPSGVEELLFQLLEKSADARPATAAEVVERLSPFRPAVRPARTTGLGRKTASAPASAEPKADGPGESGTRPAGQTGDTLHSTPPPKAKKAPEKPSTDTVALVEKATAPRQLSASFAVLVILALSIIAGLTVYILRLRSGTQGAPPSVGASAARPSAGAN
jgi:serine/threonine-protein kinase